jgi:NAD(P)-dependent dehydrogenase (short-subunit alcohol dehydrogenase family)
MAAPSTSPRRVALVADASFFVGPALCRVLAGRGHDLAVSNPEDGLVAELEGMGATVAVIDAARDLADPATATALVAGTLDAFGRMDAACAFSGQIVIGRFLDSSVDDLHRVVRGCLEAPYHFLRAVVPPMVEAGDGQVLLLTSAAGARPTPGAPLYSSARAAANMLVKNVAGEVARTGVQVNAVGTNFMDFPEFRAANGADDPEVRRKIESRVPMRRLGTVEECAAFCGAFLDGTSRFTTGQFVGYAGGWV